MRKIRLAIVVDVAAVRIVTGPRGSNPRVVEGRPPSREVR